jgi:hypothetical protein
VGPAPIPRSLSSTTGALAASAPRRFALRDPRARPAPPDPFPSTYASIYVRACRSGRRYVRRRSAVFTSRGDVRSLPVTTSHQWGDVVPSRRAVCSPLPTRRSTCVRAGWAAATLADARRCPPQGGTRALSPSHPPLLGGTGGDVVRSWEAPCRPGAEGWRSRTWSCALAVPDVLAVRYSNPNRYRPRWVKQVSSDKASPPTHCAILVSRNRGSPDCFESKISPLIF